MRNRPSPWMWVRLVSGGSLQVTTPCVSVAVSSSKVRLANGSGWPTRPAYQSARRRAGDAPLDEAQGTGSTVVIAREGLDRTRRFGAQDGHGPRGDDAPHGPEG